MWEQRDRSLYGIAVNVDGVTVAANNVIYQVEMNDPPKCA